MSQIQPLLSIFKCLCHYKRLPGNISASFTATLAYSNRHPYTQMCQELPLKSNHFLLPDTFSDIPWSWDEMKLGIVYQGLLLSGSLLNIFSYSILMLLWSLDLPLYPVSQAYWALSCISGLCKWVASACSTASTSIQLMSLRSLLRGYLLRRDFTHQLLQVSINVFITP